MSGMENATPCTWDDESICEGCDLSDDLNCRYDREILSCFRKRHLSYRILAFLVTGFASWATGLWLILIVYAAVTLLNFTVIETWYLCRHCPFYAKESRTIKCITLAGLPRIWRYDPTPITKSEQITMVAVGGFIDLFPLAAGAYAILSIYSMDIIYNLFPSMINYWIILVIMILLTFAMLGAAGYFGKYLADEYCVRCVNFSCTMNKVDKALADEYLRRNPGMRKAWEECGYELDEEPAAE